MRIGVIRESKPGETRVAATPKTVEQLRALGYDVLVERGAGTAASFHDAAYAEAGARIGSTSDIWGADVILAVNAPNDDEIARVPEGSTLVGLLSPGLSPELVEKL